MTVKLAEFLDGMGPSFGRAIKACGLVSLWGEVVDERVGKHTEPVKISHRTLYVSTSSSTWAQELGFLKKEIIEKFNQKAGSEVIRDIRFKATGLRPGGRD